MESLSSSSKIDCNYHTHIYSLGVEIFRRLDVVDYLFNTDLIYGK